MNHIIELLQTALMLILFATSNANLDPVIAQQVIKVADETYARARAEMVLPAPVTPTPSIPAPTPTQPTPSPAVERKTFKISPTDALWTFSITSPVAISTGYAEVETAGLTYSVPTFKLSDNYPVYENGVAFHTYVILFCFEDAELPDRLRASGYSSVQSVCEYLVKKPATDYTLHMRTLSGEVISSK